MNVALADSNLLIAMTVPNHVHHRTAQSWLAQHQGEVATCPITQGALLRLLIREGRSVDTALTALEAISQQPNHVFWPDDIGYEDASLRGVIGHRQVTDAYLAALAEHHGAVVATLDRGLALLRPDATLLIGA